MAPAGAQLAAFALALSGVSGVLAAALLPSWTVRADAGSGLVTAVLHRHGLWMDCTWLSTGVFSCAPRRSVLALPARVQAARAAVVLAGLLSAAGACAAAVGMECTRLGGDPGTKRRASGAAGLCLVAAGVLGLIPTVWYVKEIVAAFLDRTVPESHKHEPGAAVYVAFIAAMLLLISGSIFCTSYVKKNPEPWLSPAKQERVFDTRRENSVMDLKDYV
ncbi:LOW QUALITY PROTEIN: claudin-20 [Perognathus longimembris pacificus]|uniref:LOW QUALITY PROTEIN: claudin-20 n=1 Tax=Perognathus longimembris pacificus TaxID=214514 RepID=UPI002018E615|nr:LOW QUALITY PROTEIN: claudin-20 [Perognathus longimembris pacificus]